MGSVVKSVGSVFGVNGGGGGPGPTLNKAPFDISAESQKYNDVYNQQLQQAQAQQAAANSPAVIAQLSQQALGQGPSLAEAQLKSATNRNLAQQLAAAASMRGRNPAAAQRQVLQQQGQAGRQLAEDSVAARLQEQQQAASQLAQQQSMANSLATSAAGSGFQTAIAPKQSMQQYEQTRFGADVAKTNAIKAQQTSILGDVLGAGGKIAAASASGSWDGGIATSHGMSKPQYAKGGKVAGKEVVPGDSPKNDTVAVKLSPGEIVVPKSHATSGKKAGKFVQALLDAQAASDADEKADNPTKLQNKLALALRGR